MEVFQHIYMIILEESKLDMQDWRWALRSFLRPEKVLLYSTGKSTEIPSSKKGMIDPRFMRVRFSGYMIRRPIYRGFDSEDL